MDNKVTATSVRKLVDKYFSLQWCRDNLVVPLYTETSLPMEPGIIKIAIANYSYLGTIAEPMIIDSKRINIIAINSRDFCAVSFGDLLLLK